MPPAQSREAASVSINIRAKARQRDLIDQAAERLGRSRSDFMLEAAYREAEDVLLDQAFFSVDADTFAKFQTLLDHPLPPFGNPPCDESHFPGRPSAHVR